jgi:hypothetical protein
MLIADLIKRLFFCRFSCGEMVLNECDMKSKLTGHKVTPGTNLIKLFYLVTQTLEQ